MDPSKPGKGILASLEHKTTEPPRRSATFAPVAPSAMRGGALVAGSGILVAALLAWWMASGPSPLVMHDALPPAVVQTAPFPTETAPLNASEAAAIIDEATPPALSSALSSAPSSALAAMLAPAPIATVMMRRERAATPRPQPRVKPKVVTVVREPVRKAPRSAPDTDVALLSALVAHANTRDVVESRAGDSTESLLERCRRVGGEEGHLCRIRICTSRAGDGACHADRRGAVND